MKNNNENFQNQFNKDLLKFGIIGFICYVLSYLMLEDGITKNFFLRMFPILLVIFVCILLLFFLVRKKKWYLKSIQNLSFNFSKSDFTFYLIPLSIIFHFYLTNFFNS